MAETHNNNNENKNSNRLLSVNMRSSEDSKSIKSIEN
jgi:hypothetical protein